jgi:6 kDa early secretory antigenic target
MTQFTVDSEQVMAANLAIQDTIQRLSSESDRLYGQLVSLQSSWTGVAASSFQDLTNRWKATAAAVDSQLSEVGKSLAIAAQQYSEIEYANQRLFQQ